MSASLLRAAAAKMRERAEAATPGPWLTHEMSSIFVGNQADGRTSGLWEIVHMSADALTDLTPESANQHRADAEHIASWHPAVALAAADLLDLAAAWVEDHPGSWPPANKAALAVARAYLGRDA